MLAVAETGGGWWRDNGEIVALAVSVGALVLSVWSTWRMVRSEREATEHSVQRAEWMARAATYQRIHEALVDPLAASGRRQLFLAHSAGEYPSPNEDGWDEINYALALYDTLGAYVQQGYVDAEVALTAWHHPLVNITPAFEGLDEHRRALGVEHRWGFLQDLLRQARDHRCNCGDGPNA